MKTLMTTLLLAGTALMAQTGTTPAPAAGSASKSATPGKRHWPRSSQSEVWCWSSCLPRTLR